MAIEITMPKLSDTMEEGTILKWQVKEGDRISQGDIIAEVETDKAAMEMEAFEDGTVRELRVPEGETVPVGTVIAVLEAAGEAKTAAPAKKEEKREAAPEEEEVTATGAREAVAEKPEAKEAEEVERKAEREKPERKEAAAGREEIPPKEEKAGPQAAEKRPEIPAALLTQEQIVASPAARKLADERGLDLARVRGTGPGGRIVLDDVEKAVSGRKGEAPAMEISPAQPEGEAARRRPERSPKIRRIVGRKMAESWQSIPHFFVTVAVDMTDIIRIRKDLGVSINDFIVAAAARCLQEYPWVNSHWVEGEAVEQPQINIAIAVATDRGLYNPVLRDCSRLSLREIGRRASELVARAHAGRLNPEDLEGGTFTISNMGMLGVESFTAIITPPQAAVLAVGTVKGETVVDDKGEPGVAPMVRLTLSADHRILDGADAAEFLTALKSYLEAPITLVTCTYGKE